jgi:hypothetical protein
MLQNKRFYCPSALHGDVRGSCDITLLSNILDIRRRSVNLSSGFCFGSRGTAVKKTHFTAVGRPRAGLHSVKETEIQLSCIAALHTLSFVHGCFMGICILTGSTE